MDGAPTLQRNGNAAALFGAPPPLLAAVRRPCRSFAGSWHSGCIILRNGDLAVQCPECLGYRHSGPCKSPMVEAMNRWLALIEELPDITQRTPEQQSRIDMARADALAARDMDYFGEIVQP